MSYESQTTKWLASLLDATPTLLSFKLNRVLYPLSTKVPTKTIPYLKIKYQEINLKIKLQKWNNLLPSKLWGVTTLPPLETITSS